MGGIAADTGHRLGFYTGFNIRRPASVERSSTFNIQHSTFSDATTDELWKVEHSMTQRLT